MLVEILRAGKKGAIITRGIAIALKRIQLSKPTQGEMVRLLSKVFWSDFRMNIVQQGEHP